MERRLRVSWRAEVLVSMRQRVAAGVLLLAVLGPGAAAAPASTPLPCAPAHSGDSQPWVHNARVLASFPPDTPPPRFVGRFRDGASEYELHLWRDATGVFGELLSPVLEADSPVSRLYQAQSDAKAGTLKFAARFPGAEQVFSLRIHGVEINGVVTRDGKSRPVHLRQSSVAAKDNPLGNSVISRAQFACQMILFHRF